MWEVDIKLESTVDRYRHHFLRIVDTDSVCTGEISTRRVRLSSGRIPKASERQVSTVLYPSMAIIDRMIYKLEFEE